MPYPFTRHRRPFQTRGAPHSPENRLKLPHERDEAPEPEADVEHGPRDDIRQAQRDVEAGRVDTEARGTPSNVPTGASRGRTFVRSRKGRA